MATVEIKTKPTQGKLFPLSDSERAEKVEQLLGVLDEIAYRKDEKKAYLTEFKDHMKDAESRLANLREDLGLPESHLSPEMIRAREEERAR